MSITEELELVTAVDLVIVAHKPYPAAKQKNCLLCIKKKKNRIASEIYVEVAQKFGFEFHVKKKIDNDSNGLFKLRFAGTCKLVTITRFNSCDLTAATSQSTS